MRFEVDESLHGADDTPGLLDYVYYDTEPMEDAQRGELLDFSKARLPIKLPKLEMKKISKSKAEKAKQLISALREQYRASSYKLSEEKVQMVRDGAFRRRRRREVAKLSL